MIPIKFHFIWLRGRLKCEKLTDDIRWMMPSDGKCSLCLWQGELKIPYIPQKPVLMRNLFKCEVYK
jgi:hypothetical protein